MDRYDIICDKKKDVAVADVTEEPDPKERTLYFKSIKELLRYMKKDGGNWTSCDDARGRYVGFERDMSYGKKRVFLGLSHLRSTLDTVPGYISELISKINGRHAIGYLLSGRIE